MASVKQTVIVEEINFLMGLQISFYRSIERSKEDVARFESSINKIDADIRILKDHIWWLEFIRFCNTPCYKFKL